ncbi:MAG: 1,4-alpha-glucan branching protein GlgB [Nitrospirae bacterium]|nr:1,4-alpha-glucan branching protein GlgB [Nitrospirota bacterium]
MKAGKIRYDSSVFTDYDIYLFKQGQHFSLYEKLGAHASPDGTHFAVWAPNAREVSVKGDFNGWDCCKHYLKAREDSCGIWEGFIPGVGKGAKYKYHVISNFGHMADKADPVGIYCETPPDTASVVWDLDYGWGDDGWMKARRDRMLLNAPHSVYELHTGSWMRVPEEGNRPLTYRELAPLLAGYVRDMGFTHVELMPVMEHPFYGSWGYQVTGFFSPTSRYGTPQDFMYLVDTLHQAGIGVILDWVPSHFPSDAHGLVYFDGTHLYEHADPQQGFHPEWKSYIFNYGRNEVSEFLISSALFWVEKFHADGLRVDAVASMLYLDYGRKEGEWIPNQYGGRENIEAVNFIRRMNEVLYERHPDIQMIAEESTAWPMVSRPAYVGGLGFGMKWNMGWMHDTLEYFSKDPVYRKHQHNQLTFSILYAFTENFMLPLSHDEVVYGKRSLKDKMPGDEWQQFANLRLLFGYMFTQPGKKLVFMGGEFGQWQEWDHESSLHWNLLDYPAHDGVRRWVRDLNRIYRSEPALHEKDFDHDGFEWVDFGDWESSVISYIRRGKDPADTVLVVLNFTPVLRTGYRVGVPHGGYWREILNSDSPDYGGSGQGNMGGVEAEDILCHGRLHSLSLTLPPLGIAVFKPAGR